MDETAGAYSVQIYDYLSQIQGETKAFLLIVRHNTDKYVNLIYFEMIQRLKYILQWSSSFAAPVYVKNKFYNCTKSVFIN